jgi:hypothetical protein
VGRKPELDALVREWIRGYDALFKVPVIAAPTFDGKRAVSRAFQLEIDAVIDDLVAAFEAPVVALDPLDRDGWIGAVMRALALPTEPPQVELFGE